MPFWSRKRQLEEEPPAALSTVRILRMETTGEGAQTDDQINAAVDRYIIALGARGARSGEPAVRVDADRITFVFPVLIPLQALLPGNGREPAAGTAIPPFPMPPPGPPPGYGPGAPEPAPAAGGGAG